MEGENLNPFSRNQNILDANRDFLFKIADMEQSQTRNAAEYAANLVGGDGDFRKGMSFTADTYNATVGVAVDYLRDSMAKSLTGGKIDPGKVLGEVNRILDKYNIHPVSGTPTQIQAQLFHIMHRVNCPEDVKAACQQGVKAAKYRLLSTDRGLRRSRLVRIAKSAAARKLRRTEYGKGQEFTLKVLDRGKKTFRAGLRSVMMLKKAGTFAYLRAESAQARRAAKALKKDPGDVKAKTRADKISERRKRRKVRQRKQSARRRKFRSFLKDPLGIRKAGRKLSSRLLRTKAGRAVSFPVRVLMAVKGAAAKVIAAVASVISMLVSALLVLALFFMVAIVFLGAAVSAVSSIAALFDFTITDEAVQDKMFAAIRQCYEEQVGEINSSYANYEHVTIHNVERRTKEVYDELGVDIEETTNAAEIMSMANIYFEFELSENEEDAVEYVKALYKASNQVDYATSVSRVEDTGEVDEGGDPVTVTYYDADITITTYYFNDIFEVEVVPDSGGEWTGDMSGLPAWITPEAMQAVFEVQRDRNIPAAAILGQMILESTGKYPGGCSGLCYKNNNCLGITKHSCSVKGTSSSSWGTKEFYGKYVSVNRSFQAYKTLGDCIRCYGTTDIVSGRPSTLSRCTIDPKTGHFSTSSYVTAVWKSGYATSPTYVQNVMKIVKAYNLERFNSMSTASAGAVTGVQALISCGDYYNSALENAVRKGEKWVYSNDSHYVKQTGSFEDMLKKKGGAKYRGGNCATIANWAFRDMGLIKKSEKFYGDGSGKIRNYNSGSTKLKFSIDQNCTVIKGGQKSFGSLVKAGKIKAGDVIMGKGHTFVYRGDGIVYASGHDGKWHTDKSVHTDDRRSAVFGTWIRKYEGTYDDSFKVHYIVRLKDSFVPKYYRDASGKLVKNQ